MSFIQELKRRNVLRAGIAYAAAAWFLIQVSDTIFPAYGLPPSALTILITILGIGFVPLLVFAWAFEFTSEGLKRDKDVVPSGTAVIGTGKNFDRAIMAVLALALGYFAVDKFVLDPARDLELVEEASLQGRSQASIESYGEKSIVVLPFVNMSSDPEQEYFADGVSEELLNLLAQIPELRVISRSTAFTFKGKDIVVPDVAKKLNVAYVLEGSVRKAGNQVMITVQLIDARTDTHLWSDTYERTLDDIFRIQNEISSNVVSKLKLKLLGGLPRAEEIDPRAYELYLQARYIMHTSGGSNRSNEAKEKLERMLEYQPDFLPAISELSRTHNRISLNSNDPVLIEKSKSRVRELVARMVDLDPNSSYANGWISYMAHRWERDFQKAATYRERALASATDSGVIIDLLQTAILFEELGRLDEALATMEYVVSRDPACRPCVGFLGRLIRSFGRPREAAERLEKMLESGLLGASLYEGLGYAWMFAAEPEKALQYFSQTDLPVSANAGRLIALHDLGRTDTFEKDFTEFRDANQNKEEEIAAIYAWVGRNDDAFEWLDKMVEKYGPETAAIVKSEYFNRLQSDPRWQQFVDRNGQTDEDLSHIIFNPKLPTAVQSALNAEH
jgi:adenylate cyclase